MIDSTSFLRVGLCTYLYDGLLAFNLENLTLSHGAITEADVDDLCVLRELNIVKNDEGTLYIEDGTVVNTRSDVKLVDINMCAWIHCVLF